MRDPVEILEQTGELINFTRYVPPEYRTALEKQLRVVASGQLEEEIAAMKYPVEKRMVTEAWKWLRCETDVPPVTAWKIFLAEKRQEAV